MEDSTESLEQLLQSSRFWIQRVLVPIMVCIGVSGNIVAVMVLTRRRMRCSTNIYLTALAIADIVYLLFVFTLSVSHYDNIHDGKYELYWRFYGLAHWICDAASSTSVWLTVAFTLERYIAVCHPIKGKVICTENRAKSIIIIITIFCILTTVSTTFEYQLSLNETCINRTCTKAELFELHQQEQEQQQQQQMGNLYQINNRNNTTNNSNNNLHYIPNHNNIIVTNFDNVELKNNQLKTKIINDIYRNLQTKLKRLLSTNCSSHTHIIYIPIVYTPSSPPPSPSNNNQTINFNNNKNNSVGVVIDNDLKNDNSERDILTINDEVNNYKNNNNNNNNNVTLLENWMENELCCTRKFIVGTESTDLANNPTYQKIIQWYSALCFVLIPIIFIATFNSFLIKAVYHSQKKRQMMTNSHETVSLSNENRITIMLIGVVILFLICQTPTASLLIFNNFHTAKDKRTQIIKYILGNFFNFLVTINASCNFLLYCVLSKKFRATFKSFFIDRKHRQDTLLLTTAINTARHSQHHRTNTLNKNGFKRNISEYRTPRNLETQSLAAMPRSRSLMARPPGKAKSTDLNI